MTGHPAGAELLSHMLVGPGPLMRFVQFFRLIGHGHDVLLVFLHCCVIQQLQLRQALVEAALILAVCVGRPVVACLTH